MNSALSQIRKEINNKKEEYNIIGQRKERRKYLLTEVETERSREEIEKKTLWHYKQVDKSEKKLIFQPVWDEVPTPKKLANKVYVQPLPKPLMISKSISVPEKLEQEEQEG